MSTQYSKEISLILEGKICPYCNGKTEFVDSKEVYGTGYGMIYLCLECQAWVGVHEGTDRALGRLANAELREWKIQAHYWFDAVFKKGFINQIFPEYIPGLSNREKAYCWLAEKMHIPRAECHIGMFDVSQCGEVVRICKQAYQENI
jgi:hypothetical protein